MRLSATILASTALLAGFVHGSPVSYHLRRREVIPRDRIILTLTLDGSVLLPNPIAPVTTSIEVSNPSTTLPELTLSTTVKHTKTRTHTVPNPTGPEGIVSTTAPPSTTIASVSTGGCSGVDSTTNGPLSTSLPEYPNVTSNPAESSTEAGVTTPTTTATATVNPPQFSPTYTLSFYHPSAGRSTKTHKTTKVNTKTKHVSTTTIEVQPSYTAPIGETSSTIPVTETSAPVPTNEPTAIVPPPPPQSSGTSTTKPVTTTTSDGTNTPTAVPDPQGNIPRAIKRNKQFSTIKAGDACSMKDVFEVLACAGTLGDVMLQCNKTTLVYEKFQTCQQGQQCFALPRDLSAGYSVACVSLEQAGTIFGMSPTDLQSKIRGA